MSDGNVRIIELTAADAVEDNDFIAIDNNSTAQSDDDTTAGTRKVRAKDFVQASLVVDEAPTEDSENLVTSGGVYDAIADVNDKLTPLKVYGSASSSIATFDDGSASPLKELTVEINAVQSGSGAPYPAGGGKNKMPTTLADWASSSYSGYGVTLSIQSDGGIKINGTSSYSGDLRITIPVNFTIPSGSWTLSMTGANANIRWISTGDNGFNYTSKYGDFTQTYTITDTATPQYLYIDIASGVAINTILYIQLESGTSKTTYAPYSNIRPISGWDGTNVGDVNDTDKVSFFKGLVLGTHGVMVFDGSNDEAWALSESSGVKRYNVALDGAIVTSGRYECLCNRGEYIPSGNTVNGYFLYPVSSSEKFFYIPDQSITTVSDFKTWLGSNNLFVIYELATPTSPTITLTQFTDLLTEFGLDGWLQSISWQTQCGTVYGGDFKLFKDGGKWYCTVTKVSEGYVFTKDDEWEYTSGNRFKCNKACGFNVSGDGYNYVTNITSNFKYEYVYTSSILSDNCMTWFASTNNLFIRADGYADLTSFKAFLQSNPITIVGELATPTTTTFEISTEIATLLRDNNIFADTGDVDVTYQRDLNIVINKLLSSAQFLTQAQYDALPSSKNTDGVIYYVN